MGLPTPRMVYAVLPSKIQRVRPASCWEYANAYHIIDYRHIPSHESNIILSKHIYHLGYSTTT